MESMSKVVVKASIVRAEALDHVGLLDEVDDRTEDCSVSVRDIGMVAGLVII